MILEDMNGAGFSFGDQLSGGPAKDLPPDLAMFRLVVVVVVVVVVGVYCLLRALLIFH
jgi:hypothetical protein